MSDTHIDRLYLKEPLSSMWDSVKDMTSDEVERLLQIFVEQHVRENFAKKFPKTVEQERKIGRRFFRKHVQSKHTQCMNHHQSILSILGSRDRGDITVEVFWGTRENAIGFLLKGSPCTKTVDEIFIDEGHALARVSQGNRECFLFLAHGDELFTFPVASANRHERP